MKPRTRGGLTIRCPTCAAIIGDTAVAINTHRRNRKGACGEVALVATPPSAPTSDDALYGITKAMRVARERRNGDSDPAMERLRKAQRRRYA
jgi:hypothetical protein